MRFSSLSFKILLKFSSSNVLYELNLYRQTKHQKRNVKGKKNQQKNEWLVASRLKKQKNLKKTFIVNYIKKTIVYV